MSRKQACKKNARPKNNLPRTIFNYIYNHIWNWLYLITLTHVARYVIVAQGKETKGAKSVVDSYHDYSLIHEVKRTKTVRSSISRHVSSLNRDNNEFEMLSSWNIIWGHRGKNNSYIGAKATNTSTLDIIVTVSLSLNHFIDCYEIHIGLVRAPNKSTVTLCWSIKIMIILLASLSSMYPYHNR